MSSIEQGDRGPGWAQFPCGGYRLHLMLLLRANKVLRPEESQPPPTLDEQACPWLVGASCGVQFWARNPCWRPRRIWGEGGSANLAAALRVWQTWDFSSALCLAKPKMCLARNPPVIFKPLCIFYVNSIHMFFIYFYLTHQIELGATMMKGTVLISKKILEPFFLELNHLSPWPLKLPDWAEFEI